MYYGIIIKLIFQNVINFCIGWLDNAGSFDKLIPLLSPGLYYCMFVMCKTVHVYDFLHNHYKYSSHCKVIDTNMWPCLATIAFLLQRLF